MTYNAVFIVLHFCRMDMLPTTIWCGMQSIAYSSHWHGMFVFSILRCCFSHRRIVAVWYACLITSLKSLHTAAAAAMCSTTVMSLQLSYLVNKKENSDRYIFKRGYVKYLCRWTGWQGVVLLFFVCIYWTCEDTLYLYCCPRRFTIFGF